jgi:isopentenyl-diphosphate delta-isomerase
MTDELLDLVNEKDEIIGEVWKSEANQNPKLIHREAAVIIYDDDGKILFQKRSKSKKVSPGLWTVTAAGHVDKGEDTTDTAHRELREELGFDTNLSFFDKTLTHIPNETHFTYWYIGRFPKNAKIVLEKREVDDAKFLSPKELEEIIDDLGVHSKAAVKRVWQKRNCKY